MNKFSLNIPTMEKYERIQKRMRALGYTQTDVIEKSKGIIKKGSMSQYYNGKGFPYDERLVALCAVLKTTEPWLVNGKGIEDVSENKAQINTTLVYYPNEFPLIGLLDVENWSSKNMEMIEVDYPSSDSAFAMKVESTSMLPEFSPGQCFLCDTSLKAVSGDFVLVKLGDSHAVRKLSIEGSGYYVSSTNPDWPSKVELLQSELNIIGVIVKVWRNFR